MSNKCRSKGHINFESQTRSDIFNAQICPAIGISAARAQSQDNFKRRTAPSNQTFLVAQASRHCSRSNEDLGRNRCNPGSEGWLFVTVG